MDPDQVLAELREFLAGWNYATYTSAFILRRTWQPKRPKLTPRTLHEKAAYYDRVMERFEALDKWLTEGGRFPADWDYNGGTENDSSIWDAVEAVFAEPSS